ncbi:hypothetical protein [Sedimentitalea nanhaiensis]|uniref:Uncharacterized protein n=1 Tax=Sedimentitalea nanhaiensis TaxID=999627 RepID=A0A1I7CZ56_9RHOB|nr:hypothetical protein [Sedimentitalea nanhaiensis]SFU04721.1 hypothetical protein SAMN05216236_12125 [Sedimentitalea nanhaiensis]
MLGAVRTDENGEFGLGIVDGPDAGAVLYLVAQGGEAKTAVGAGSNPATTLMALLRGDAPAQVRSTS